METMMDTGRSKIKVVISPMKPLGDGWVRVTEEFARRLIEFDEECIRDLEKLDEVIRSYTKDSAVLKKVAE